MRWSDRAEVRGSAAMALVLVLSNYLVQFPLGQWLTYAAFTYPAAFLITDCVNARCGAAAARRVVLAGFVLGVPLSFGFNFAAAEEDAWVNAVRISLASGAAFALAHSADIAVFNRLRRRAAWWMPPLLSSVPASLLDTLLFFSLAFAATGVPWLPLAAGDFAVKMLMVFVLLPPYRLFVKGRLAV